MYKNFHVGKIKFFQMKVDAAPSYVLIDCLEHCTDGDGNLYWATYNVWVETEKFPEVRRSSVGGWVLFGFYIQAFRVDDRNYVNTFKMRHHEVVLSAREEIITLKNGDKIKTIEVPDRAITLAREISNQTKFNEYGKR